MTSGGEAFPTNPATGASTSDAAELTRTHKLEAVGRLTAGVAHEVNTLIQVVSDSLHFVRDDATNPSTPEMVDRALESLDRMATLMRSMAEFAQPDRRDMAPVDLNRAIRGALLAARTDYKYVADVALELGELPRVTCFRGDVSHAILAIVVDIARAIEDVVKGTGIKGVITVRTHQEDDDAIVTITETVVELPARARTPGDRGTALARSIVVDRHAGQMTVETSPDIGTTYVLRLPIDGPAPAERSE